MLEKTIAAVLRQKGTVILFSLLLVAFGIYSYIKLPIDAFPDVTNVQVQIATEAPGRAPEEVERFVTVPIENAMRGMPGLEEMRSLNRNGLSIITLVFTDDTDVYFARQLYRKFKRFFLFGIGIFNRREITVWYGLFLYRMQVQKPHYLILDFSHLFPAQLTIPEHPV